MQTPLTSKQQRLLDYLQDSIAASGISPSLRQAAGDLGVSHTAVAQTLNRLAEKGLIRRSGRYGGKGVDPAVRPLWPGHSSYQ